MATKTELSLKATSFTDYGFTTSAVEAGFFAPSLDSMFATTRGQHDGQCADVLLLQFVGHDVNDTLAVVRTGFLEQLVARVAAADRVLSRGTL